MRRLILGFTALLSTAAAIAPASAQTVFGLVGSDRIVTFDASTPGVLTSDRPILGLAPGDILSGIDVRPVDRMLYSVGQNSGLLYRLQLTGGAYAAIPVGPLLVPPFGTNFGIDFNPTVDRLRHVSDFGQNLRINPATGQAIVDSTIIPLGLIGSAYTNSFVGATSTSLFGIDLFAGALFRSSNPNAGLYDFVGPLGIIPPGAPGARVGFDVLATGGGGNSAFLAVNDSFYTVNLTTGQATLVGGIGADDIRGISANAIPEPATWAMMIGGFGLVGGALRRRPKAATAPA